MSLDNILSLIEAQLQAVVAKQVERAAVIFHQQRGRCSVFLGRPIADPEGRVHLQSRRHRATVRGDHFLVVPSPLV